LPKNRASEHTGTAQSARRHHYRVGSVYEAWLRYGLLGCMSTRRHREFSFGGRVAWIRLDMDLGGVWLGRIDTPSMARSRQSKYQTRYFYRSNIGPNACGDSYGGHYPGPFERWSV